MENKFNINNIIKSLSKTRSIFCSEADFQLALALKIKKCVDVKDIRLEYSVKVEKEPELYIDSNKDIVDKNIMHIDIMVFMKNGEVIPIELKYKTLGFENQREVVDNDGVPFYLKTHGAKNINCYLYLKDIKRIEYVKERNNKFKEGYTIFITNDDSYLKDCRKDAQYAMFSLHQEDDRKISGKLSWGGVDNEKNKETSKYRPFTLKDNYPIVWDENGCYSNFQDSIFHILINKIEKGDK